MHRGLFPFILTSIGFTLIALATTMPLFEWRISEISTDIPSDVQINPSWTTKLGDSLESDAYILHQVVILKNGNNCSPKQLSYVIRRSQSDETIERIALMVSRGVIQWLTGLTQTGQITIAVLLVLCGVYIWLFAIRHNRPITEAIITIIVAVILLGFLINVWRVLAPSIGNFACLPDVNGTLTLNASLAKTYYETLAVLCSGVFLELGALGMIVRQTIKSVVERKQNLNLQKTL